MNDRQPNDKFFRLACYFEGSLILVAIVLGWLLDVDPFVNLHFSELALIYGIFGTLPLFFIFLALFQIELQQVRRIITLLHETLGPSLYRRNWADLFILAAVAGISEEVLFRGVIQPWMESLWGMTAGLIGSNIIFGLVHAVTPLYALLAALVGIYLGVFLDYGGARNLFIPIVIHGLYDFLAFMIILRTYANEPKNLS